MKVSKKELEIRIVRDDGSYACPRCGALTNHLDEDGLGGQEISFDGQKFLTLTCRGCKQSSLLHRYSRMIKRENGPGSYRIYGEKWLYPKQNIFPRPENDMPDIVKELYFEASDIFADSPRGGSALLRLALQHLLRHFGVEEKQLDKAIRKLAEMTQFNENIIRAADTIRITGNNAVHPGELNEADIDGIGSKLFGLLNYLVRQGITEPKNIESIYSQIPEAPRRSAEQKDNRNKEALERSETTEK